MNKQFGNARKHLVENVVIENLRINGRKVKNAKEGNINLRKWVKNIKFQ